MALLRKNLAIDLGTTSILVATRSEGVVLKEPSVVAFDTYTDKILAVGQEAKDMLGRTPGNIIAMKPLKDGVISDYRATERMLKYFIKKTTGFSLLKPDAIICVPSAASQVQKRAVIQAASQAGINKTYLIEEPLAAAIGSGVDISDPSGNMIIDIGGGTTDVAVISMGGIVVSKSIRIAGNQCDQAIIDYVRNKFNIIIGEKTAEKIKISMDQSPDGLDETIEIKGRNLINGLPVHVFVSSQDMNDALNVPLTAIADAVHDVLSDTPPELASDLFDNGVLMTGGGSLIKGLDKKIQQRIGLEVKVADNAESAVVLGTQKAGAWIKKLEATTDSYSQDSRKQIARRESLRKR